MAVCAAAVLYVLFFLSGFAALLYQVVWQRTLFSIYGINVESVTMVVTAFMLGLGLGSLLGGAVSKNPARPTVLLFSVVEFAIGLFGLLSLPIFRGVGNATLLMSSGAIAFITFLLLLVPTMCMGGTLPLLVAYYARRSKNVGRSVGMLYFINTLGSAISSLLAVAAFLGHFGQSGTVRIAVFLNWTAAVVAFVIWRRGLGKSEATAPLVAGEGVSS